MRRLLAVTLAVLATPALAQQPAAPPPAQRAAPAAVTEEVRALAGPFELTDADSRRRCTVTLEAKAQGPGLALVFDKAACGAAFPFFAGVATWALAPGGAVRFLDGAGRLVAEFGETEVGLYETARPGDGIYFLSNHAGPDAPAPTLAELVGAWALGRQAGRPGCRLTLTDEPAPDDSFRVTIAPNCEQAIAALGVVAWKIERHDVVLTSARGDKIRFEKDGPVWRKVPAAGRPLVMSR